MKTVLKSTSATGALHASGMTLLALIRSHLSVNTQKPIAAVVLKGKTIQKKMMNLKIKPQKKPKRARTVGKAKQGNAISLSLETKTFMMLRKNANVTEDTWPVHKLRRKMKPFMSLPNEGKRFCLIILMTLLNLRVVPISSSPI